MIDIIITSVQNVFWGFFGRGVGSEGTKARVYQWKNDDLSWI